MDSAAMQLTAQAYSQMAYVFRLKMENHAEVDALRRAADYQGRLGDTLGLLRSWFGLAGAFETLQEPDSAQVYLNKVWPCADTIEDADFYWQVLDLQLALCFDRSQFDSCFQLQRKLIDFKARRGMDTKNDSVSFGMFLFFSGNHAAAKPYLLKVLDADCDDVQTSYVMLLAMQAFEEEGLTDSAAYCQRFVKAFVEAETERFDEGVALLKQYEQFKAERDARLSAMRERKTANAVQRNNLVFGGLALLLVLLIVIYVFALRKRHSDALKDKDFEALKLRVMAVYGDKLGNKMERIAKVFNEAYPNALTQLKAAHPDLTEMEVAVSELSLFQFRTKEVADILGIRENTVSKYRTNIKRKTQSDSFEALWERFMG